MKVILILSRQKSQVFHFLISSHILMLFNIYVKLYQIPSRHLLVQSQQWKQQNNMLNLFKVNIKKLQNYLIVIFLVSLLLNLKIFHTFFRCFYYYFAQVNSGWVDFQSPFYRTMVTEMFYKIIPKGANYSKKLKHMQKVFVVKQNKKSTIVATTEKRP